MVANEENGRGVAGVRGDGVCVVGDDAPPGRLEDAIRIGAAYDGHLRRQDTRQLLEEECWATLCWRCANLQGFRQAPAAEVCSGRTGSFC